MDSDLPTEIGPTEEIVDALLEYLVVPLLPSKHSDVASETPSEAQQKSVAKQVHAAVVLYNYFHLKDHRECQFLKFDQFCDLAIMLRPSILHHMKYKCQLDRPILDDPENQLSPTEKAIMDACTLSETLLNASDDISNVIKEWSITKVAVLLIDLKKENCFLKFNDGMWSVIEKDLYPESKKRKKTMIDLDEEGEAGYQKLALSAVKEDTDIGNVNGELKFLESHMVYSLSQAKTATLFYIVQSTQSVSRDSLVSIEGATFSLQCQGPVVKECSGSWVITPVVEFYYYLLPYAEIISKLFASDSPKGDMNESCRVESNNSSSGANNKSIDRPLKVHELKSTPTNSINSKEDLKDLKQMSTVSQRKDERVDGENKSYNMSPNVDRTPTVNHPLEDFHSTTDAKRSELSEAALRALLNKRQKLYQQQEVINGELTLCDKKIQAIRHGGIGDCLSLKLDAIIDCCNEICKQDDMQTKEHTNLHVGRSLSSLSGKRLSEAQLTLRKACQELDDICLSNNWMLPIYHTTLLDGGVVANVTLKGANFECSGVSGIQPSIHEARNSAATHAIMRLQQMANEMNTTSL